MVARSCNSDLMEKIESVVEDMRFSEMLCVLQHFFFTLASGEGNTNWSKSKLA